MRRDAAERIVQGSLAITVPGERFNFFGEVNKTKKYILKHLYCKIKKFFLMKNVANISPEPCII
jgi:hypothetical protein